MNGRRDGLVSFCLFALLFSAYLLTFSGVFHSSDEMSMLAVTDSLARRGEVDINLYRWLGLQQGQFGPDGNLYSHKGLGMSLAALPFTWLALGSSRLGNVQAAMLTNAVLAASTAALLFLYVRRLRFGRGVALGVALLYGLATMAWVYARYLFSEQITGLTLLAAAFFLLRYRDAHAGAGVGDHTGSPLPTGRLQESPLPMMVDPRGVGQAADVLLAGLCLGITLLTRLNDALVVPLFALWLIVYAWQRPESGARRLVRLVGVLALLGLPIVAALAADGAYNWLRFGNPLDTGYLFGQREQFSTPLFVGLYGLTFSPGRGLFWYNPILLAALAGWPALVRRRPLEGLFAAGVGLYYLLFWSLWYLWWGGHSWGPRFLVAMLPFAALPLAPVLEAAARRRTLAIALGVLAILSLAVQLLGIAVNFNLYLEEIYARLGLYHPATLFNPAYSPLLRQVAYLRPENLDLAWARQGAINWPALLTGLALVLLSGLALWAAHRRQPHPWAQAGLLLLLILGTLFSMLRYAPTGDAAEAARALAAMERPSGDVTEAAALTDPLLTAAFQDAYDGHLPVWGVPSKEEVGVKHDATWVVGAGDPEPASGPVARFQVGTLRLDFYPPPGQLFDAARLPVPPLAEKPRLGDAVELVAVQSGPATVRRGETLPVTLYWRALAAMKTSYTAFVQAIDGQGVKAGQVDRPPCDGGCPTTGWRPGDLVGERYDLPIRPDAPPGTYQLIAGMYDLTTGESLPWLDAQGNAVGSYLVLGTVQVQP